MVMDRTPAIAFLRQDSSGKATREHKIISSFARKAGFEIVAAVTDDGSADIIASSGFARVLNGLERNAARTVIVASAESFASDPLVQAVGRKRLSEFGISLIAADGSQFTPDTATTNIVERILDHSSAFEKLLSTAHIRGTNERLRLKTGPKWRKQYIDIVPDAVRLAKDIYELAQRAGTRITLREISAQLAKAGHVKKGGKPFHPQEIDRMIKGPNRSLEWRSRR
jgi:DNA invertase Pin-like site-specific DNA recombinase